MMINSLPRTTTPAAASPLQSAPGQNLRISAPQDTPQSTSTSSPSTPSVKTSASPVGQSPSENDTALQGATPQPSEALNQAFSVLSGLNDGDISGQDIEAFKQVMGGFESMPEGDRQALLSNLGENIRAMMSSGGDPAAVLDILATSTLGSQNGKQIDGILSQGVQALSAANPTEMPPETAPVAQATQGAEPSKPMSPQERWAKQLEADLAPKTDEQMMQDYKNWTPPDTHPQSNVYWTNNRLAVDSMATGLREGGHTEQAQTLDNINAEMEYIIKTADVPLNSDTMDRLNTLTQQARDKAMPFLEKDIKGYDAKVKIIDKAIIVAEKVKELAVDGIDHLADLAGPAGMGIKYGVHAIIAGIEGYTDNDGQGGVKGAAAKMVSEIIGEAFGDLAGEGVGAKIKAALASAVTKAAGDVLVGMQSNGGSPDFETFKQTFIKEMVDSGIDEVAEFGAEGFAGQKTLDELASKLWDQLQEKPPSN